MGGWLFYGVVLVSTRGGLHTYTHIHPSTHTGNPTHIITHTHIHTYTHTHTHSYTHHTCIRTQAHARTHMHAHTHTHTYIHAGIRTDTHACTHPHPHTHTYPYIDTHMAMRFHLVQPFYTKSVCFGVMVVTQSRGCQNTLMSPFAGRRPAKGDIRTAGRGHAHMCHNMRGHTTIVTQ